MMIPRLASLLWMLTMQPRLTYLCGIFSTVFFLAAWAGNAAADWKPPVVIPPTWTDAARTRNAEMKRRVDRWLADGEEARMPLHVVYLSCSDQEPFVDHVARINRVLTEIQESYAVQHEAAGFGRTTFALKPMSWGTGSGFRTATNPRPKSPTANR